MAIETFVWDDIVLEGATGTETYRVLTSQFGDGYKQVAADGINNVTQSWQLSLRSKTKERVIEARNFLKSQQGYKKFYWTPPMTDDQLLFICSSVGIVANVGEDYNLTATFEQSFNP